MSGFYRPQHQWQAQPVPQEAGAASSVFLAGLLPLKSLAYQPVPFSWKLGAETCFSKLAWPHCGQVVETASLTLRISSALWPQLEH